MSQYIIDLREAVQVPQGTITVSGLDLALDRAAMGLHDLAIQIAIGRAVLRRRDREEISRVLGPGFLRRKPDATPKYAAKVSDFSTEIGGAR